ncbi:MAG: dephospho-CoA kinase [Gemmatimonadaceae bacterium]
MITVGLTGNIASGKSAVSRELVRRGATLIDADVLAREVVEPNAPALAAIVARWGGRVLQDDGTLNRGALRAFVFRSPAELEALNAIVHPMVEQRRRALIEEARARGTSIVFCDIPLLFEKSMQRAFDYVVLVDADESTRLQRLVTERGLSVVEASQMMAAQMPSHDKRALADFIIDNDGTFDDLAARIDALWDELERRAPTH